MKARSILTSLICVAALGAATLPARAGERSSRAAATNGEQPDQWPKLIASVPPKYPANLLADKVEGSVTLALVVNTEGVVTEVSAVASDRSEFEAAALEAVKQWKFTPGRKDGRSVNTRIEVPIKFELPAAKATR